MRRKGDRYSVQTSLIVAALRRLLPIGLNICAPGDQELIALAKNRLSMVSSFSGGSSVPPPAHGVCRPISQGSLHCSSAMSALSSGFSTGPELRFNGCLLFWFFLGGGGPGRLILFLNYVNHLQGKFRSHMEKIQTSHR